MSTELYLDANATSPVLPAAIDAALAAMGACFGNPSSSHACGLRAKALLDATRASARRVLGAHSGRVMFTSGATEGIQTAVLSALCALRERRQRGEACGDLLLYGATEHKAVPESLAHWNRLLGTDLELRALPVDADGRHRLDLLRELAPRAAFVCTMAANNETGVVSDLDGIARVLAESGSPALWMVDCVQALGKLPLQLDATRIDYAPFSGHKLYAPKGIGLLYVREGAPYTPLMCGGGQEAGQRSGTENMAGIAALGAVLAALEAGDTFRTHVQLRGYRERLVAALRDAFPTLVFNAPLEGSLPTTLNFSVPGMSSKELLDLFDAAGVRVSAGSACSAAKVAPSYVLDAMGVPLERSASAVRLSFGPLADDAFIESACARILHCGRALADARPDARLQQLESQGASGWLLFGDDGRHCIAIDPPAAQAARIAADLRARDCGVLACFDTSHGAGGADALAELLDATPGWPGGAQQVVLQGRTLDAIAFGEDVLAKDGDAYLLGRPENGVLAPGAVRFVFGAAPGEAGLEAALCCHRVGEPAVSRPGADPLPMDGIDLDPTSAAAYLAAHPDALLVDVRELPEHAAAAAQLRGRSAHNVPLSQLAGQAVHWLREPRPLVFVCRSGNRSARAARLLRRLGHAQAWHVAGGLALAN
ncbi:aminotransferase class V-fold PLP-dependent enzyme [Massilia sp. IC2-477]|uniref:aminotransferase class V-fold PLP-dependent enzyme n=1 Tax=Massilia sp. IC2-477 TaxID=2887198 RepID=UPI001D118A34|nr:aminotransferase class V-fold PLP-dependent enzyme [Massilia sp. IC2-477]MCC2958442.1 aminotransferase class V-fold PLP-dependent enzyme [Massilia sp. IC2-477]